MLEIDSLYDPKFAASEMKKHISATRANVLLSILRVLCITRNI